MTDTDRINVDELIKLADKEADNGEFASAIEYYNQYLKKNPNDARIYNRVGYLYGKISEDDYSEEQIKYFEKALEVSPNYEMAIRNLAIRYQRVGEHEKSIEFFHKLFALGAVSDDYFAYACEKIRMGDFEEGWAYYEFRFLKTIGCTEYPRVEQPRWEGQPIPDKTLLVQCEQGFGDTFQFLRYIYLIRPLAKKIIFRVQNELLDLIKDNIPYAEVVGLDTPVKKIEFDYHTPLMSLPFLMKTTKDTIPGYKNYLKADPDKVEDYKKRFFNNDCFKIGISWEGMLAGNMRRNIKLQFFYPLTELNNVKIYSFQKGRGPKQLEQLPENVEIVNLGEGFNDFSDTAAAMENLDLFITSDNALFNLAGAMGKKTFILLNKNSEWRWFFDEETTPWYDTARIFKKQTERDSWGYLMDRAIDALKEEYKNIMQHTVEEALEILSNLGFESIQALDYMKAIVYYSRYIELNPNNPNVYNSLGYAYKKLAGKYQNLDLQIENFEKALELDINHDLALRNLALTYPIVGRYEEALECFRRLFKLAPVMDDYVTYAYQNIQLGNFEEGWKYLEYRFIKKYMPTKYPEFEQPRWEGQPIPDKTLLVQYEQGFGDSIQFCRYIEQVKPFVKKIIFRVQDELVDLMKMNLPEVEIVGVSTNIDDLEFDYHVPLISLLYVTKARIDNIPFTQGYISADEKQIEKYKNEYFDNDCFKIGISWNGTQFGNESRDIPLSCFYQLTKLKNVKVYSLQKGFGALQLNDLPADIEIVDLGETFNDFSDTAAAMANLDLFITSDNSVFNLAGSMAKKTFLLLNKFSEWRWFFDEESTPWYDSVKIFKKQNELDDWDILFERVLDILKAEMNVIASS